MTTEMADLYRYRPPVGLWVPLHTQLAEVDDGIALEAEIKLAVRVLKEGRVVVPLGMRAEDLKVWLW